MIFFRETIIGKTIAADAVLNPIHSLKSECFKYIRPSIQPVWTNHLSFHLGTVSSFKLSRKECTFIWFPIKHRNLFSFLD